MSVVLAEGGAGHLDIIRERPVGFAQRLLTAHVTRLLLGFRQRDRITLSYRRGRVVVEWPGGEANDARLDEARRVGSEISSTIEHEFQGVAHARKPAA